MQTRAQFRPFQPCSEVNSSKASLRERQWANIDTPVMKPITITPGLAMSTTYLEIVPMHSVSACPTKRTSYSQTCRLVQTENS